jgi:hypothetical protein
MKYTINILQESKAAFIIELLSGLDYIQIEPEAKQDSVDWWDELPDSVKQSYEQGVKDGEAGRVISMEEMMKKYR